MILLPLTIAGCRTTKVEEIELPPKPQRVEQKAPESLSDLADLLNYYEHLVQDWESWADTVTKIIE